jgi:flagellar basal-body rod protein FlgB
MLRYLGDSTTAALEKALQGQALRQRAVATNLANVDTPGYRPQRVRFEEQLQAALQAGGGDDSALGETIARVRPEAMREGMALRRDGNGVEVEREMAELADSGLQHHVLVRLLARKLQMLKAVATEGGK